jgi:hypothetical protein
MMTLGDMLNVLNTMVADGVPLITPVYFAGDYRYGITIDYCDYLNAGSKIIISTNDLTQRLTRL